jgi:hypothetical protein
MDRRAWTSLQAALSAVPDPRQARGQRSLRAIFQWMCDNAADLVLALAPPRGRLLSPSTLRRAARAVEATAYRYFVDVGS